MHCRKCRYSEGHAQSTGGRWRLLLWCTVHHKRAKRTCSCYAAMECE